MAKGQSNSFGRSYAGQNAHRGPALSPNNHDGGMWPSTTGNPSGTGRGQAAPRSSSGQSNKK